MAPIYRPPSEHPQLSALDGGLLEAVAAGAARLTVWQGLELFHRMPLTGLGRWADARCRVLHGDRLRTYVIDRNINYTNVCTARCTFCAFRRDGDDHDAYTLPHEAIHEKIAELVAVGGTQILMQGGMNAELPLEWYVELLSGIKSRFPNVHIHAFSPPEFVEFVRFFDPPGAGLEEKIRWVMARLKEAGLDSVPGGGGEIFAPAVRRKIGLGKCSAEEWLTTMRVAHGLGMFTSATMMFGHIEGIADRVGHMAMVREWQDAALLESGTAAQRHSGKEERAGGHYVSFISWPFQRENTPLGRVREWGADESEVGGEFPGDRTGHPEFGRRVRMSGSTDYLRTQALSRLMLDNIYSIGASWVTMGPHIGQVALAYGASDMGSVMMEENVVSSAGTTYCLDEALLCRLIRDAGYIPAQRNNTYEIIRAHPPHPARPVAPDLAVTDWSLHRARAMHQEAPRVAKASLTVSAR